MNKRLKDNFIATVVLGSVGAGLGVMIGGGLGMSQEVISNPNATVESISHTMAVDEIALGAVGGVIGLMFAASEIASTRPRPI